MKKYILILIVLFTSCRDVPFKDETINTEFVVTHIGRYKYTRISGYIIHNGIKVPIDNGSSGYYYKKYSLRVGDRIPTRIRIQYFNSPNGYTVNYNNINLSQYEH